MNARSGRDPLPPEPVHRVLKRVYPRGALGRSPPPTPLAAILGRRPPPGLQPLLPASEPAPATVRDVADLLHIDVDHGPRFVVFVASDRLAGSDIDMMQPVQSNPHQHRVNDRGRPPDPGADPDRSETLLPPQMHNLAHQLRTRAALRAVRL